LSFFLKTLVSVIIRRSFGRQFHSAEWPSDDNWHQRF